MTTSSWHAEKKEVFEHFDLKVMSFKSSYSAGFEFFSENPLMSDNDLVFSNNMALSLETTILTPKNKAGKACAVHINTTRSYDWEAMSASDIPLRDEDGQPRFALKDKRQVPVINDLVSIGSLDRNYRYEGWTTLVHLPINVIRDFQFALVNGLAPYVCLNFMRIAKTRMIKTIVYDAVLIFDVV